MGDAARVLVMTAEELRAILADALAEREASGIDEVLSREAVCTWLDISAPTLMKLVKDRGFPGFKVESQWRFLRGEVLRWMREQGMEAARKG